MTIRPSNPLVQYGTVRHFFNRELAWDLYGIGAGKYGIDFLEIDGGEIVLDIGSGTGRDLVVLSQRLRKKGKVFAIDISKPLLDVVRHRVYGILCANASVNAIPFSEDHFDVVIAKHVLNHVGNIDHALREVKRVVKRKGTVIITTGVKTPDDDFLRTIHREAIGGVGIETDVRLSQSSFSCSDAKELLPRVFGKVNFHFYSFQMVFPETDSFMLYYTTLPCFQESTSDVEQKKNLARQVRELVGQQEMPIVLDRSRGTFVCTKV